MKTTGLKILFIATVGISALSAEMIRIDTKEVVIDTDRKLMWQDDDREYGKDSKKLQWHQAINYCDNLVFAGFDDWYLPSMDELNSIKSQFKKGTIETTNITDAAFKSRLSGSWSSTGCMIKHYSHEAREMRATSVAFAANQQQNPWWDSFKSWNMPVRCVRQMQSNESVDRDTINESNRQETIKKER
ncbi:MAG: hypothetical protein QG559_609, partial [Campylobacterota bacterium]|nr:hypothetical protein [Campylobacterota bacterium]